MYCAHCGTQNADGSVRCTNCGSELPAAAARVPPPVPEAPSSGVEKIIPYRNAPGLIAYYLGVFSLLGGFVLGVPALILGVQGVRYANLHPEARGKAHAWTGIILGSLMTLISLSLIGFLIVAMMRR